MKALLLTPGQFARQAELYHQLYACTSAGLGLVRALQHLRANPPAPALRPVLEQVLEGVNQGRPFAESLRRANPPPPVFDLALLEAGEQSGRLDACFKLLSDFYQHRAQIARQVIGDLLYPLAVFHLAIFLFPFAEFFRSGEVMPYLLKTFGVLLPLYAAGLGLVYAAQAKHREDWRAAMEKAGRYIPGLGQARQCLALARLAAALEALISAGVPLLTAWELAAAASGSPALRRAVQSWKPRLASGQKTPAEEVSACAEFPPLFAGQYHAGEISGKLDETLRRVHLLYQEEGTRKLHTFAQWTPRLIFFLVAMLIAYRVVTFWLGYFQQIGNVMK
jgi:type IV pilus assembly protein PilC